MRQNPFNIMEQNGYHLEYIRQEMESSLQTQSSNLKSMSLQAKVLP
jgi:hypothetical protein